MKKRELVVFAGQSNMMGAGVLPPKIKIEAENSFEYKHKNKRLASQGEFTPANNPAGEFSYVDIEFAYSDENRDNSGNSRLNDYIHTTYFCPAMYNLSPTGKGELSFSTFSESAPQGGACIAPLFAMEWEGLGQVSAYAHIAKGGVSIKHYFTDAMGEEYKEKMELYNEKYGRSYNTQLNLNGRQAGAAEYFCEKTLDFFSEAEEKFQTEDLSRKIFVWIQGESDAGYSTLEYLTMLEVLWGRLKSLGFTHFFMVRIDFFGNKRITNTMDAQELFCKFNTGCYMATRALSYIPYPRDDSYKLYKREPVEYKCGRDTAYGHGNPHINEEGFAIAAKRLAMNMDRVLNQGQMPLLEEELVTVLKYDNIDSIDALIEAEEHN